MRILMINYEFPPLGGGGGVACYYLAKELAKEHQVDYLTSGPKGMARFEIVDGIRVNRVPILGRKELRTATSFSLLTFIPSSLLKGAKLCMDNKYDIINAYFVIPSGITGVILSKLLGIPLVLSALGGDIYDPSKRWSPHRHTVLRRLTRYLLDNSDAVTAESNDLKNKITKYHKIKSQINVVPLGFSPVSFKGAKREDFGLSESDIILISVGRLIKRKAYDKAIQAVAKLPWKNVKYLIIGDGPEKQHLRALAKDMLVEEMIQFRGFVSEERKFQYLSVSDIYILSSQHEGFGICLLEAMHCGLPIVATDNGGQTDFLIGGRNALLVPAGDDDILAQKIAEIIKDKAMQSAISANNRKDITNFYIDTISKRYINLYQKTIEGRRTMQ